VKILCASKSFLSTPTTLTASALTSLHYPLKVSNPTLVTPIILDNPVAVPQD